MKKSILSGIFVSLLLATSFVSFAQTPNTEVPCAPVEDCPTYCTPVGECTYTDCDQQPLLDCYSTLADKYRDYGEDGRRAELANNNKEVQQLYNLKYHFEHHVPTSTLTTDQQLQLQGANSCMM